MAEFYAGQDFLGLIGLLLQAVAGIVGFGFDELAVFRNDQVLTAPDLSLTWAS